MTKEEKYDAYLARQRGYSRNYRNAHKAEVAAYYKQWYQKKKQSWPFSAVKNGSKLRTKR